MMLCMLIPFHLVAQEDPSTDKDALLFMQPGQQSDTLPFRLINNLIVIPVRINNSDSLFFILDTGLGRSIITELGSDETVELKDARPTQLSGFKTGGYPEVILSTGNTLDIGDLRGLNQDFIVLTDNTLQLSSRMGTMIH